MKSVSRKELIFLCIYRVGFDVFKFGLVGIELPKGRFSRSSEIHDVSNLGCEKIVG